MSSNLSVYIGYDPRQPVAFNVAAHSLVSRLSLAVPVTRLQLSQLPITRRGLTEFTYSRFLVPFLSNYAGYSLFVDADTVTLRDVHRMFDAMDPSAAVSVVQHERKFERPSVMLFNNKRCRILTPSYVQDAKNGLLDLAWAERVGTLDPAWNFLVGYDNPAQAKNVGIIHYTQGIPIWPETSACDFAEVWHQELENLTHSVSFQELMGSSVHVQYMPAARKI